MFAVAAVAPSRDLTSFGLVVSALAIVHATHDIACDGFNLQALYSGSRLGAYRLAMIVGSSALVYLAGKTNWMWGFGAAGALMIVTALVNAFVMRHPAERPVPEVSAHPQRASAFLDAFRSFIAQPQAPLVLSFMLFYRLGDSVQSWSLGIPSSPSERLIASRAASTRARHQPAGHQQVTVITQRTPLPVIEPARLASSSLLARRAGCRSACRRGGRPFP